MLHGVINQRALIIAVKEVFMYFRRCNVKVLPVDKWRLQQREQVFQAGQFYNSAVELYILESPQIGAIPRKRFSFLSECFCFAGISRR